MSGFLQRLPQRAGQLMLSATKMMEADIGEAVSPCCHYEAVSAVGGLTGRRFDALPRRMPCSHRDARVFRRIWA